VRLLTVRREQVLVGRRGSARGTVSCGEGTPRPGFPRRTRPRCRQGRRLANRGPAAGTHRVEVPFLTSHIMHLKASALLRKVQTLQSQ